MSQLTKSDTSHSAVRNRYERSGTKHRNSPRYLFGCTWSSEVGHTTASGARLNRPVRRDQTSDRPCPVPCLARSRLENDTWASQTAQKRMRRRSCASFAEPSLHFESAEPQTRTRFWVCRTQALLLSTSTSGKVMCYTGTGCFQYTIDRHKPETSDTYFRRQFV